jgi:hypothetical protein
MAMLNNQRVSPGFHSTSVNPILNHQKIPEKKKIPYINICCSSHAPVSNAETKGDALHVDILAASMDPVRGETRR